ncbi:MAG: endo-1,4-beta-xylanase [Puniceicoccaceae bacterium]
MRFPRIALSLFLISISSAFGASLTPEEVSLIESELGITLSEGQKTDLAAIVRPDGPTPQWRQDAEGRIATNRTANLEVKVVNQYGQPVHGAQVDVKMVSNDFRFGGVMNLKEFSAASNVLSISTDRYKELFLKLFNAGGLDNGFKQKQRAGNEHLVPDFINWAKENELPIRGHTLIWPGTPNNNHLPANLLADVEAVEQAIADGQSQATIDSLKETLKTNVDAAIAEWASLWDVYEWDVINETLTNHRVQDLIGDDQMAEWFKIARANVVQPDCELVLNEYQIISAMSDNLRPGHYASRADPFKANIDRILADGGPLTKIGFQSRIKFEHRDPQLIYDRLEDFGSTYGLPMVGTEFEVRDGEPGSNWYPYDYTEFERAQITEEMMTQYFSHPLVEGLFIWTYMKPQNYTLCYPDGTIKLNGLVWYYMHRIKYNTESSQNSDTSGLASMDAYKGSYDLTVTYGGKVYQSSFSLGDDMTVTVPVVTEGVGTHWGAWEIDENNWVDTGDWLGRLQVQFAPWVWSLDLEQWLYFPIETVAAGDGWCWINNI